MTLSPAVRTRIEQLLAQHPAHELLTFVEALPSILRERPAAPEGHLQVVNEYGDWLKSCRMFSSRSSK